MPDADERVVNVVDERPGCLGRLAVSALAIVISISLLVGLASALDPRWSILRLLPDPIRGMMSDSSGAAETVEQVLGRCASGGPDHIGECRLLLRYLCNQPALETVTDTFRDRNDHLAAAMLGEAFLDQCDGNLRIGLFTAQDRFRLTDFETALRIINRFPEELIGYPEFASWRGFILEKLDRHEDAALDFERSLYLFSDITSVAGSQFYHVVRALKAAGRYCDAISPIQLFVSFDPAERLTTQIEQEMRSLRDRGNCEADRAPKEQTIELIPRNGLLLVKAAVNGVVGTFLLDTGASTMHLTREFARKAEVLISADRRILIRGVAGSRLDYLGTSGRIEVGSFLGRNVRTTVASDSHSLGNGIDGLLGQTFLSRFRYEIKGSRLSLGPVDDDEDF